MTTPAERQVKTDVLTGPALDWAVAKAEGWTWKTGISSWFGNKPWLELLDQAGVRRRQLWELAYSTDPDQAWPIIEREDISVHCRTPPFERCANIQDGGGRSFWADGKTILIAAMRCYVAFKIGDTVEIPEELLP